MTVAKPRRLTKAEGQELVRLAQQGDQAALVTLMEANVGLIHRAANDYFYRSATRRKGLDLEDLVQVAKMGFVDGVMRFDLGHDVYPMTYIVWRINAALVDVWRKALPLDTSSMVDPLTSDDLNQGMLCDSDQKLAFGCHIALAERQQSQSQAPTLPDDYDHDEVIALLDWLHLEQRNRALFDRYFGLDGEGGATLDALADEFALSRERVRQILSQVILKLRKHLCPHLVDSPCRLLPPQNRASPSREKPARKPRKRSA